MEPEGSLPQSQVPDTCPYPEPDRSSPYPHVPLPEGPANIMAPSTPWSSKWFFPSVFPTITLYALHLFPIRATCPAHFILLDLTTQIHLNLCIFG